MKDIAGRAAGRRHVDRAPEVQNRQAVFDVEGRLGQRDRRTDQRTVEYDRSAPGHPVGLLDDPVERPHAIDAGGFDRNRTAGVDPDQVDQEIARLKRFEFRLGIPAGAGPETGIHVVFLDAVGPPAEVDVNGIGGAVVTVDRHGMMGDLAAVNHHAEHIAVGQVVLDHAPAFIGDVITNPGAVGLKIPEVVVIDRVGAGKADLPQHRGDQHGGAGAVGIAVFGLALDPHGETQRADVVIAAVGIGPDVEIGQH
ncbi:hypothetical protein SDC9_95057 [bioreactor metagenome]|uniref:Uncharacterized protein n=1 Tax=bioreactor metagenome TaxID=1076179 RepID=A0A645ABU4_9ZZZZ